MKIVKIVFQNAISEKINGKYFSQDVTIFLNDEEKGIVREGTTATELIETNEQELTIRARSHNAIDATYKIESLSHGDSFTFVISLDNETRELKLERKF